MFLFYDADSDTLQTRTRRYARDRNLVPVIVPVWEHIEPSRIPDWERDVLDLETSPLFDNVDA